MELPDKAPTLVIGPTSSQDRFEHLTDGPAGDCTKIEAPLKTPLTDAVLAKYSEWFDGSGMQVVTPDAPIDGWDFARQLERDRAELIEALLLTDRDCEHLHHAKKHRHTLWEPCPVEAIINNLLSKLSARGNT